jgi:hypothetical protein
MANERGAGEAAHELRAGLFANRELQRRAVEGEDCAALSQLLEHEHRLLWLMLRGSGDEEKKESA